MQIALSITHAPWIPERVENMRKLWEILRVDGFYHEETERCPNWVWSENQWRWSLETGADYCLFLQDDLRVAPDFWKALWSMLEAVPDQVISLYNGHPATKTLAREGYRWCTTADGLVGMGYVFPRALLQEFVTWRSFALKPLAVEHITEDTLIDVWCVATGRKVWHPIPTIIDHLVELDSSYGNDAHRYRRPSVTWEDADLLGEEQDGVVHLGRFYRGIHWVAKRWLKEVDPKMMHAAELDECPEKYRRMFCYP